MFMQSIKRKVKPRQRGVERVERVDRMEGGGVEGEEEEEEEDRDSLAIWASFHANGCPCCNSVTEYSNWATGSYGIIDIENEFQTIEFLKKKYYYLCMTKRLAAQRNLPDSIEKAIFAFL